MKRIIFGLIVVLFVFYGCVQEDTDNGPALITCPNGEEVSNLSQCPPEENQSNEELVGCAYENPSCEEDHICIENECVLKQGCSYSNPSCDENSSCIENECVLKQGCSYNNPSCEEGYSCIENECKESCNFNSDCSGTKACFDNLCVEVECKVDSDCNDPSLECDEYSCKSIGKCLVDMNCESDEVCIAQNCNKVLDCTSGECVDNYFKLEHAEYIETPDELQVKAKITAKTDVKGSFKVLWNEVESAGYLESISMSFDNYEDSLQFWIYLTPPTFSVEHYVIEHEGTPKLYYLIYQNDYYE